MAESKITLTPNQNFLDVHIEGMLDEDVKFDQFPINQHKKVIINLGKATSINSVGIREWIKWLGTAQDATIEFHECPKAFVIQMNIVLGFLPKNGHVKSIYIPYYCDSCDAEKKILFTDGQQFGQDNLTPIEIKDDLGHVMDPDVDLKSYLKFSRRA